MKKKRVLTLPCVALDVLQGRQALLVTMNGDYDEDSFKQVTQAMPGLIHEHGITQVVVDERELTSFPSGSYIWFITFYLRQPDARKQFGKVKAMYIVRTRHIRGATFIGLLYKAVNRTFGIQLHSVLSLEEAFQRLNYKVPVE